MKLSFSKFKTGGTPQISSIRKKLFNANTFWFLGLATFSLIFIIAAAVGFKFFYSVYFETYKNETVVEEQKDPININNLKAAIKRRSDFQNATSTLPSDPSI